MNFYINFYFFRCLLLIAEYQVVLVGGLKKSLKQFICSLVALSRLFMKGSFIYYP